MKPVPAPAELDFEKLPTFDVLRDESGLKTAELRKRLASVPCWRCTDNSVRYDRELAAEAIEPDDGPTDSEARTAALFKQMLETIKTMGEPLRQGLELQKIASDRQEKRLEKHEANFDRMVGLIQELLNHQHERDLKAEAAKEAAQIRSRLMEMLETHGPAFLEKWALTSAASEALDFIGSLDPAIVDGVIDGGVLNPDQTSKLRQLRALLARKAPPAEAKSSEPPKEEGNQHGSEQQAANGYQGPAPESRGT